MKKTRLLALTTSYPLHPGGSAGVFVQSLYRHLSGRHAIDVICPADQRVSQAAFDDFNAADIRVHAVRYAPRAWRTLAQQSGGVAPGVRRAPWRAILLPALLGALFWRCLVRAGDADLIHANWAVCGVMAGIVGRLRGKPVITTLRGDDVVRASRSRLDRTILTLAMRNSRAVVCVSNAMAEQLRLRFPRRASDIHTCLNGVDEIFFRVKRANVASEPVRVLAIGSLIRRKGFDVLIEAVARTCHGEHLKVVVVGCGPEHGSLLALAKRRGVLDRFHFVGEMPPSEIPNQLALADLFVLPSRSEGRPNVVIEALASGLPVISTNLPGVQGMVESGDSGWLVTVGDADELAAALDQAIVDRAELYRRGERARELANNQIGTWADTARTYDALFQASLASHGREHPPCAG